MFKSLFLSILSTNVYSQYVNGDIMPPMVGGQRDDNDCLISAGYTFCESSNSCIRAWETSCSDHYTSCDDCLSKQRNGINIACPISCGVEAPISIPLPEPKCPEVMCMMYCENGMIQDSNGCNTCQCNDSPIAIDPMPPIISQPMPSPIQDIPVINPFLNTCSINQMTVYHECNSDCHNCDFENTRIILSDCMNNDVRASNDLCQGEVHSCSIPYNDCNNEFVCPKITEVTDCGENGLQGYSTYRLSLIVKNSKVRNIYAIYGDEDNSPKPMIIPSAYQSIINFNSNIGGVLPAIMNLDPDTRYDSWLTIGITDGNGDNEISTVGIDFSTWSENTGIHTTNGAVFTMDPEINVVNGDEYVVAQITIPNDRSVELTLNAQGKTNCEECNPNNNSWKQEEIIFSIVPPRRTRVDTIPQSCATWFDGCNTCQVINGQIRGCTRMMCFREENPYCTQFQSIGH